MLLGGEDVGCDQRLALSGELDVGVGHLGKAEHLRRVDERQQVVDLEGEQTGQLGQVVAAAAAVQDLQEPGQPAHAGVGQGEVGGRSQARVRPRGDGARSVALPVMIP